LHTELSSLAAPPAAVPAHGGLPTKAEIENPSTSGRLCGPTLATSFFCSHVNHLIGG